MQRHHLGHLGLQVSQRVPKRRAWVVVAARGSVTVAAQRASHPRNLRWIQALQTLGRERHPEPQLILSPQLGAALAEGRQAKCLLGAVRTSVFHIPSRQATSVPAPALSGKVNTRRRAGDQRSFVAESCGIASLVEVLELVQSLQRELRTRTGVVGFPF